MRKIFNKSLKLIILTNCISAILSLIFWMIILFKIFLTTDIQIGMNLWAKASTLGFLVSDLVIAIPLLIISIFGLLKLSFWGWIAAQMSNILWIYSVMSVLVRDIYTKSVSPGSVIFLPFALFSIWSTYYLWINKSRFNTL